MNYDIVTIGNAVIDAFLTLQDSHNDIHVNQTTRSLAIPYGKKILLESCSFMLGGNACNVAVGLTRAGFKTALMAELGTDEFSEKILNGLKHEKVGLDYIQRNAGPSSFSVGLNFQGERTLFVEHHDRAHAFPIDALTAKALYLTSLGVSWRHVYRRVGEYVQRVGDVTLALNPGSVQHAEGADAFSYLLPMTTILFVNKEEAENIIGARTSVEELLVSLKKRGVSIVSLTDGEKGAYAIDENGRILHQEKVKCPVVERTGAGDAYGTGFLAAYVQGKSIEDAMKWGVHNAASVIGHIGSQPGLLSKEELAAL